MDVEFRALTKRFASLQALSEVSFSIRSGTVHALVGENGAGKSTLVKILAGVERADRGEVWIDGAKVAYKSPHDALSDGVTIIAQELALEPGRTVIENVFLGIESHRAGVLDRTAMRARYAQLISRVGLNVPADAVVGRLRTADQQRVEILRALARHARLIVMDEPTAALTTEEAGHLLDVVRALRADGTTIVYVSHFLNEVLSIADNVTVLRDGHHVQTTPAADESPRSLVSAMLGGPTDLSFPDPSGRGLRGRAVLSVRGLTRPPDFADIDLDLHAGEVVGLAGLIGSGRTEVARAIFGADPHGKGTIEINGKVLKNHSPREAIRAGICMLPESRQQGLFMRRSIVDNVTLPHLPSLSRLGVVHSSDETKQAQSIAQKLDVRAASLRAQIRRLSGGNQQKSMFAKWLLRTPQVLIIDEPTRGVDVGAKHAIYRIIDSLASSGMAVLVISSEIEEIMGLSNRILVMRTGRVVEEFTGDRASKDAVLRAAFGTHQPEEASA